MRADHMGLSTQTYTHLVYDAKVTESLFTILTRRMLECHIVEP